MNVFNQMAHLSKLNAPGRATPWAHRQETIGRTILLNGKTGWDWVPFAGYALGPMDSIKQSGIALAPHAESGKPAQLVVDSSHGCLMVGFEKSNDQNAADALALLHAFREKSIGDYNYHGHYEVGAEGKVLFTPHTEPVAAQSCPAMKPAI